MRYVVYEQQFEYTADILEIFRNSAADRKNIVRKREDMEAIRTIQTVKEGHINVNLPQQFWGQQVEVIVLAAPAQDAKISAKKRSLRGCLHHYANPALIEHEQEAWEDAVKEKYDHY